MLGKETQIVIVAATRLEILPTINYLEENFENRGYFDNSNNQYFIKNNLAIKTVITGVGLVKTAFCLARFLPQLSPETLVLQVGIGGAYQKNLALGEVVHIVQERFGDLGAETSNGDFLSLEDLGFENSNEFPFENGVLKNNYFEEKNKGKNKGKRSEKNKLIAHFGKIFIEKKIKNTIGNSVNKTSGNSENIAKTLAKYPEIDIESMEGAAFFYACKLENKACLQIRAISNYVESRNRDNWKIGLAIGNLNNFLINCLENL